MSCCGRRAREPGGCSHGQASGLLTDVKSQQPQALSFLPTHREMLSRELDSPMADFCGDVVGAKKWAILIVSVLGARLGKEERQKHGEGAEVRQLVGVSR